MAGQVARMKHESFQITEDSAPRKKIIRQDRTPVAQKKVFLQVGNYEIEVLNVSSFGLAGLVQEAKVPLLKAMFEQWKEMPGVIRFNNVEAQRLNVKLARIEPHPQSVFNDQIVGFEVFGGTVAVDRLKALELSDEMLRDHTNTFKEMQVIPAAFKLMVFEMKGWLTFLKEKIDTIEKMAPVDNADDNSDFKQTIAESVSEHIGMVIPQKYQDIPKMMADMDDKTVATCTKFIRSQIGPLVYGAPFANRAFYKPRGYAGDYEMMNHLYRNELVGATLFDQCMHKYFIDEPAAKAVKNRAAYLLEKIRGCIQNTPGDVVRILAVASGPAMEQQMFIKDAAKHAGKKVQFTCLDQDEESLKHAQKQIMSIDRFVASGFEFKFINLAIKNILARGVPDGGYDLIYSAGLFDYFTDPVAQMAGAKLFEGLNKNGTLVIGNFSKDNPSRPFMEMVLEWHLLYRSPDEMAALFKGLDPNLKVEKEPLGINLFAIMKK